MSTARSSIFNTQNIAENNYQGQYNSEKIKIYHPYRKPPFFIRHPGFKKPLKMLVIFLLTLAIGIGSFFAIQNFLYSDTAAPIEGTAIITFGDSITYGFGTSKGKDYSSLLAADIGEPVINLGKNGNTTANALARIDDVLTRDPKLVIIFLGGNDVLRRIPAEETFSNLSKIIEQIQTTHARILLIAVPGGIIGDPYKSRFKDLAKQYDSKEHPLILIPEFMSKMIGNTDIMYDAIHPNTKGHAKILEYIEPQVKKLLGN
jgi:acyl-CoA thioesterase-1